MFIDVATTLAEADACFADARPFAAHEVLEAAWHATVDDTRGLWRALAQLAVGMTHVQRGNRTGAIALLRRAADGLDAYAGSTAYDVDVDRLRAAATAAAQTVDERGTEAVDVSAIRLRG